jgi:hypothetical protein
MVDRGQYLVDQPGRRLRSTYGDGDGFGDLFPFADRSLARRAAGKVCLLSRAAVTALNQILEAQMG